MGFLRSRVSRVLCLGFVFCGCGFDGSQLSPATLGSSATGADASSNCGGADLGFDVANLEPCSVPTTTAAYNWSESGLYLLDTNNGILRSPSGSEVVLPHVVQAQEGALELFVVGASHFAIGEAARLIAIGSRAVVLVSSSDVVVNGVLLAGSYQGFPGAGANDAASCGSGAGVNGALQVTDEDAIGGSGGGGGGFGDAGGSGAPVDDSDGDSSPGGVAVGRADLVPLRGGCRGGWGGGAVSGGHGGGAIQVVAAGEITISGTLAAPGQGGAAGTASTGGGGGGSGGGILLQAREVVVTGAITANGGGGGEGRQLFLASSGENGALSTAIPAAGGEGTVAGGRGGDGGAGNTGARDGDRGISDDEQAAGGGGGGGSVGRVRVIADVLRLTGAMISPPAN